MDGTNIVDDVTVCYRDIRISVKADNKGASQERVLGVEGVTDKTHGVDGGATLEGGAGLDVGRQGKPSSSGLDKGEESRGRVDHGWGSGSGPCG